MEVRLDCSGGLGLRLYGCARVDDGLEVMLKRKLGTICVFHV